MFSCERTLTQAIAAFILLNGCIVVAQPATTETSGEGFFIEQIEPLLKRYCFECHSHASGEISGGLTLDSRSGWSQGGLQGPAIVPGKPAESLLVKAVRRSSVDLKMPPDGRLPDESIALLEKWIRLGAADPRLSDQPPKEPIDLMDWWSLRWLQRPELPADAADLHPIDAFVRHRLSEAGLSFAPLADRRTLIRRLYFDLHGLPPTPDDVAAFVEDSDPAAYEKLVDRLLDSPRYGERWARHWLDAVHFADSHGCEHDVFRAHAWRYRDYVIGSLNRDTPWPRFLREQLAVDHFYPDETHLTPALGFIAAGPLELSRAGTAPVTFDYLDRDDMVTQTMAVFASTTANCARCHDHKFDPITQEDYYSLQAVFAGVGKGDIEFDADPVVAEQRRHWNELLVATKGGDLSIADAPEHAAIISNWERKFGNGRAVWERLRPATFLSSGGATLKRLDDHSVVASGVRPDRDTYTITASTTLTKLSALRLDVLADPGLPMKGPGRQDNGNLHLSEFEAYVFDSDRAEPTRLEFSHAIADWDQAGWTIAHSLDEDQATAWGVYPKVGESHHAVFELTQPLELNPQSQIVVVLKQLHGGGHLIGRLKLYATNADGAAAEVLPESVAAAIQLAMDQRTAEQHAVVAVYALQQHADQQLAALPVMSTVYAVSNHYSHAKKLDKPMVPKVVHVLSRGDIEQPGEVAVPGALSAIKTLSGRFELTDDGDERSRRAAIADWLASPENPLTWRSIVNRVWSHHFGRGLCDTPNDFGRMGSLPSHPKLLDWLAVWFRDNAKGSLKQLHRKILLSHTYRQSLAASSNGLESDPQNRLLWRANRRPLDAESFRDAVLQISGRIDLTIGGPGIQQFTQSKGAQATPELDYDAFDWSVSAAARRSIYRVVWRGIADPFMESLDFPDLGLLAPKRSSSVSALQALAMFNNDFVLHHSQVLADELEADHTEIDEQVVQACRLIYLREPSGDEKVTLVDYAEKHGIAATCRVLFNSNEFVFVP